MSKLKISIESWQPDYGSPIGETDLDESRASLQLDLEMKADAWSPISPEENLDRKQTIYFIDGVRRIEAIGWLQESDSKPVLGICVSIGAGAVRADDRATVIETRIRRLLFSPLTPDPLSTKAGVFEPVTVLGREMKDLNAGIQNNLRELEVEVASSLQMDPGSLMVVDGPLTSHKKVPFAIGYIKTHQVSYLPEVQSKTLSELKHNQRTPIFSVTDSWSRYSWYLRLPGPASHPLSGIVRLEAAGELELEEVKKIANNLLVQLPRYASVPHKDPRAPQNLFPISGLERELKRRLGDTNIIHRALKIASLAT